jgi:hypothetical protein
VSAISDRHGTASLVNVNGNLTLDGILNVGNGGSFGAGAYRLLNYTGVLDDETLQLGILPLLVHRKRFGGGDGNSFGSGTIIAE